jgi:DNA-binding PadR family transcriptional regulator
LVQCPAVSRYGFGAFFSVAHSQVYRELPALSKEGLVRLGKQGPRSSQQYVLTAAGKKTFKTWLTSEAGPDHLRRPFILRLVHADSLTAKQRKSLLESARASYSQQLDDAKTAKKSADGPYEKAIAELAHAQARAALKLLDAIAKQ